MRYLSKLGEGKAVSVCTDDKAKCLEVRFERKILSGDISKGKLVPTSFEGIKRRGGKRRLAVGISYESAEALHLVLGRALKDMRNKRSEFVVEGRRAAIMDKLASLVYMFVRIQNAKL